MVADLIARLEGAPEPTCGDGSLNVLCEECDGADLGGNTCAPLLMGGTVTCDGSCQVDLSGCTIAPKRAFVTSSDSLGDFGGLAGGDAICQARADSVPLGGSWTAWLSDSSTDAKDRITDSLYTRVDETTVIATSLADLTDGSLLASIRTTQTGANTVIAPAWTGTRDDGTAHPARCGDWMSKNNPDFGRVGSPPATGSEWTSDFSPPCNFFNHMLCFED